MRILIALLIVAAGVMLMPDVLRSLQRSFIYFPLAQTPPPVASVLPGAEEVRFTTADGVELNGWWRPGSAGSVSVIVFNGNAGDRSHRAPLAAALAREGLGVLLFDYRGYAGQRGTPSEEGLAADARAAVAYLQGRRDVDAARIAYFGESLGAAVATTLAAERAPAALVLRSPFTSLEDMARLHYPWLPVGPLLVDRYGSMDRVAAVRAPVLVIAGTRDGVVPLSHSHRLFDAARQPKRFVAIDGADHNDLALVAGPQVVAATAEWLRAAR
ncbi:MAG: alpha/beta hydrolase, partial [Chloroflexi bacterium]|nr:alpha/beta hydrolase [Chloroflexota bacterium]